jgi:phage shock protein A
MVRTTTEMTRRLDRFEVSIDNIQKKLDNLYTKISNFQTEIEVMKQRHDGCPAKLNADRHDEILNKCTEHKFRLIDIVLVIMSLVIALAVFLK